MTNAAKGREAALDLDWETARTSSGMPADVTGLGAIQGAVCGKCKSFGLLFGPNRPCSEQYGNEAFEMNLGGMVISVAQRGGIPQFLRWHRVETSRQSDVAPESAGNHGDYNPRLVSADEWNIFQKVWSDIASHRNRCRGIGGVTSRNDCRNIRRLHCLLAGSSFFRGADGEAYPGNEGTS